VKVQWNFESTVCKIGMMPVERNEPKYTITKIEGARRTLHAAIRMVWANEDPLIIYLLAQSVDGQTANLSEHRLGSDVIWDHPIVKQERKKELFGLLREPGNFLKHADRDPSGVLEIYDTQCQAEIMLFLIILRYRELTTTLTAHMKLYLGYHKLRYPDQMELKGIDLEDRFTSETLSDPKNLRKIWDDAARQNLEYMKEYMIDTADSS
jgi:hypothetical protein